jgi:integrase
MSREPRPWRRSGGSWYSQVAGEKVWLAPRGATKKEAQEELYRVLAARGRGARKVGASLRASGLIDLYLGQIRGEVTRGERTQGSYDVYAQHLKEAAKSFGAVAAHLIEPRHVEDWTNSKDNWGPSTRSAATKIVKAAWNWARRAGHLKGSPLADCVTPRARVREAIPSAEQSAAILAAFDDEPFRDLLTALRETGCRPGEIYSLTADRVDVEAGVWRVTNKTRGKTGETLRTVYLTAAMAELSRKLVARHPEGHVFRNTRGNPWNRKAVAKRLWKLGKATGMGSACNAYANRHRYATDALLNNVPVATVATLLGHKRTTMVMSVYSRLALERDHLKDAAEKARGDGSR